MSGKPFSLHRRLGAVAILLGIFTATPFLWQAISEAGASQGGALACLPRSRTSSF